jgi:hypothetical protein
MRHRLRLWMFGLVVLTLTGLARTARADVRDDLSRVTGDYEAVKSHYETAKSKLEHYLDGSVALRRVDNDELNTLITQICRLDVKRDDDEAARLAREIVIKVIKKVGDEYERTVEDASNVFDDLGQLESEAKSVRNSARDLESKDEVKSDAERLRQGIETTQESIGKLFDRINSDRATLDRVKSGTMNGANNPMIRARIEYGKEMHKKLQSDFNCDEKEIVLSSGRRIASSSRATTAKSSSSSRTPTA